MTEARDIATLVDLVRSLASDRPGSPAILAPGVQALSHRGLADQIEATGAAIRSHGIGRADVVALVVDNGPAAATGFLGIACAARCAPLNPVYREAELEFYLDDLGARLVVVGAETSSPVREVARRRGIATVELRTSHSAPAGAFELVGVPRAAPAREPDVPVRPDDVALVLHTSGTTSRPKLVPLSHANLCASAANVDAVLRLSATDRCLNVMPLFHIHGLVASLLASLWAGGSIACAPGFRAASLADWIGEVDPTWMTAVPTMLQSVLARVGDDREACAAVSRLSFLRSSSAALPGTVKEGLEEALEIPVIEAYGMTEAAHQIASNPLPPAARVTGSVGLAAGPEVAILDIRGEPLAGQAVGEVAIRGENVFSGYVSNEEANAAAFVNGWFRTGDQGWVDADGYLHLTGRLKEIINRGGEKIAPAEVDEVLLRHPSVAQAVTFALPDSRLGEEVAAAVVARAPGAIDERALQDFVAQTLAPFKVPRRIVFVDEIPKGPTGKLQRIGLHEQLGVEPIAADSGATTAGTYPRSYFEHLVFLVVGDALGRTDFTIHDDFFALGGDSLLGAEVIARLRDVTGREELPLVSIVRSPTVASLAADVLEGAALGDKALVQVGRTEQTGRRPLFLVHGVDGDVLSFPALARRLGGERDVFGFRAPVGDDGSLPFRSFEEMAEAYLGELLDVQPSGPYLLGGVCAGGPVAIEIARLLTARAEHVELLVLIDPRLLPAPSLRYQHWRLRSLVARREVRLAVSRRIGPLRRGVGSPSPDEQTPERRLESEIGVLRDSYVLRPLAVRAALLTSGDYEARVTPSYVWSQALEAVERVSFEGPHGRLFLPPTVDHLAAAVRQVLAGVDP